MSTGLLNSAAVARRSNAEAAELLGYYIKTDPHMAHNMTQEAAPTAQPKGAAGAVDPTNG